MNDKQILAFKNRLKNYTFVSEEIQELNEELKLKWYNLAGVKGVSLEKTGGTTNESVKNQKKLKAYDEIEKLENQIKRDEEELNKLDDMLYQMPKFEREMAKENFIYNHSLEELAKKHYMDRSTLARKINREMRFIEYV